MAAAQDQCTLKRLKMTVGKTFLVSAYSWPKCPICSTHTTIQRSFHYLSYAECIIDRRLTYLKFPSKLSLRTKVPEFWSQCQWLEWEERRCMTLNTPRIAWNISLPASIITSLLPSFHLQSTFYLHTPHHIICLNLNHAAAHQIIHE